MAFTKTMKSNWQNKNLKKKKREVEKLKEDKP